MELLASFPPERVAGFTGICNAAQGGVMRHPKDMGVTEVEAILSMLANERKVSASTHNPILSVLLFLYREVLNID